MPIEPANHPALPTLGLRLRREAHRLTDARQAILRILQNQPQPLSSKQIFDSLPPGSCDLATVYRALHLLERLKIVQRLLFDDRIARFELRPEDPHAHVHHLVCTRCASVIRIHQCFPPEWERQIAATNGYRAVTHRLEFFGLCPRCQ